MKAVPSTKGGELEVGGVEGNPIFEDATKTVPATRPAA